MYHYWLYVCYLHCSEDNKGTKTVYPKSAVKYKILDKINN